MVLFNRFTSCISSVHFSGSVHIVFGYVVLALWNQIEQCSKHSSCYVTAKCRMEHRMQRNPWEAVQWWTQLTVKIIPKNQIWLFGQKALWVDQFPNDTRPRFRRKVSEGIFRWFGQKNDFDF